MTSSGDFIPQDSDFDSGTNYPTLFGIAMTPMVLGILLGVLGLLGGIFAWLNLVQPVLDQNNALSAEVDTKEEQLKQIDQIEADLKKAKTRLAQVQDQRTQVLSLFASEKNLNTLLYDLNQVIEKNNAGILPAKQAKLAQCPGFVREQYTSIASGQNFEEQNGPLVAEAKLRKFKPIDPVAPVGATTTNAPITGLITDGSYGPALDNKLKRQAIDVEFQGNFNQTQNIFRTIERLQPLLIIRDLKVERKKVNALYERVGEEKINFLTQCQTDPLVTTTFKMEALLPLTPEDAKAATDAAAKAAKAASPAKP